MDAAHWRCPIHQRTRGRALKSCYTSSGQAESSVMALCGPRVGRYTERVTVGRVCGDAPAPRCAPCCSGWRTRQTFPQMRSGRLDPGAARAERKRARAARAALGRSSLSRRSRAAPSWTGERSRRWSRSSATTRAGWPSASPPPSGCRSQSTPRCSEPSPTRRTSAATTRRSRAGCTAPRRA